MYNNLVISNHYKKRCIDRNINLDYAIKEFKRYLRNNLYYNLHTRTFFIKGRMYFHLIKNNHLITIYRRDEQTRDKLIYKNIYKCPKIVQKIIRGYIENDIIGLEQYRILKKYNITI